MKVKLRQSDRLFTQIVRKIYNYTCQKCNRTYSEYEPLYNLGVSHYYGRSRENTRFDLDNVTLLCNLPCHREWETIKRDEYKQYMINRLGQDGFDLLELKASTYKKRDDKMDVLYLKQKIKELE